MIYSQVRVIFVEIFRYTEATNEIYIRDWRSLADVTSSDRFHRRGYSAGWECRQHGCRRESNQVGEHSAP